MGGGLSTLLGWQEQAVGESLQLQEGDRSWRSPSFGDPSWGLQVGEQVRVKAWVSSSE
jgi:hypothetical protein